MRPVMPTKASVLGSKSAHIWADFFLAPLMCALALLASLLISPCAYAQSSTGAVSPVLNGSLENLVARMTLVRNQSMVAQSASTAGLQIALAGEADIGRGVVTANSGIIGRVMMNEARVVPLARVAADGKISGPTTTTTTSAGTTTTQTSYTVSPNTDANSLAANPLTLTTTTTTTNPDGTTSTTTTSQTSTTQDGANPQPQPASAPPAPIPCGLGISGSPKCQIDETGTKQQSDVDTAQQTQTSALTQAEAGLEAAANSQLSQVDSQHQTNSAHFFTVLNMMPSFGTETCTPPTINDTFNHVNITPAICDWYYAAKDVLSLVIAFGFMLGAVFMVKDTAQSTAAS